MTYKYQSIWDRLKADLTAEVTVSKMLAPTLIQGVRKVKWRENAIRKGKGMITYFRMKSTIEPLDGTPYVKVKFWLTQDHRL